MKVSIAVVVLHFVLHRKQKYIICDIFCFFDVFPNGIEKSEHFISNKKRVDLLDFVVS